MIRGILLAAGASRRMGGDKLSLPWRGATVLAATIARWTALDELTEILLVRRLPNPDERWPKVRVVLNPGADEGMGSSLRVAAEALPPDTTAVVVGLGDMPDVATATLAALVAAWRPLGPQGIVAPRFQGRRGHPVVFGGHYVPELCALGGDEGARALLARHADHVTLLAVADPGVLVDLDVPADLGARP